MTSDVVLPRELFATTGPACFLRESPCAASPEAAVCFFLVGGRETALAAVCDWVCVVECGGVCWSVLECVEVF